MCDKHALFLIQIELGTFIGKGKLHNSGLFQSEVQNDLFAYRRAGKGTVKKRFVLDVASKPISYSPNGQGSHLSFLQALAILLFRGFLIITDEIQMLSK